MRPVVFELEERFSCNLIHVSFSSCSTGVPDQMTSVSFLGWLLGIYCVFTMIMLEGINLFFGTPLKS